MNEVRDQAINSALSGRSFEDVVRDSLGNLEDDEWNLVGEVVRVVEVAFEDVRKAHRRGRQSRG